MEMLAPPARPQGSAPPDKTLSSGQRVTGTGGTEASRSRIPNNSPVENREIQLPTARPPGPRAAKVEHLSEDTQHKKCYAVQEN